MKILKSLSAVFLILLLSNCVFTKDVLWSDNYSEESFIGYLVDEKTGVLVLVGENKNGNTNKDRHYYLIESEEKNFSSIVKMGTNEKKIKFEIGPTDAKGSKILPFWIWLGFDRESLSNNEIELLKTNDCAIVKSKVGCRYIGIVMIRYPSSRANFQYSNIISFSSKDDVVIVEKATALKTIGKIILTPFALIADTILIPFYVYDIAKESKADHFCEGDFCGYDKVLNTNNGSKDNSKK